MYGSAIPLIMVQFNGQYHTLIGMIYEVLDREKRRTVGTALKQLEQRGFNQLSLTGAMETIHLIQICMENKENMSGSFWIGLYLDLGEIGLFRSKKRVAARILIHLLSSWPNRTLGSLIWCAISRSEALEYQEVSHLSCVPHQSTNLDTDRVFDSLSKEKTISITFHPPTPPSSDPGRDSHSRAAPSGEESSKMLLRHEEGLQSFVFHPGETREVLDREKRRTVGTALKQLEQRGFNQLSLTGAMETIHLIQICMENKENMSGSFWIGLYLDLGEIGLFRSKKRVAARILIHLLSSWPNRTLGSLIWCAISRSEALEYQETSHLSCVPHQSTNLDTDRVFDSLFARIISHPIALRKRPYPSPFIHPRPLQEPGRTGPSNKTGEAGGTTPLDHERGNGSESGEQEHNQEDSGQHDQEETQEVESEAQSGGNEQGEPTGLREEAQENNKLRRDKQELVVVKEKPELEDEYGDQTTRPPDQKDVKLRVHGLMLMTRTWIGSSWREAFNCKLNKVEKSSALEATCSEESSKMLLRHEEGLQSFVFHPGETREVMIYLMARSGTLEYQETSHLSCVPHQSTNLDTDRHPIALRKRPYPSPFIHPRPLQVIQGETAIPGLHQVVSEPLEDQPAYWSELPLKPAERRSVVPVLSLKQEEEKQQASILASPIQQIEESHKTEPEPTTLCLKLEEEAEVAEAECGHVPDQIKQEEKVPGGSSKALELVLPTVEQGDNFKSLACELLIRPLVCLQLSLVEHLRVVKGLQQVVFEPGGSLCVVRRNKQILDQKATAYKLNLQGSFTLEKQDLWSNLFKGRENGMIKTICRENEGESGGNTSFIRFITDQNKLRRDKQELVVVKEKPELEDEYGDQTTRPPDQKDVKLRVHGLMLMTRTWIGSSWREAFNCKLNKVEKSSALEATCSEESSKMLLRHEEGLQSFVFHPGETREVMIYLMARSGTLEYQETSHLSCVPHQSTNLDTDRVFDSLFARIISVIHPRH
ncbi:hypothetical protein IGI04_042470 [Brassica rapa subsp. trilocularis]|uniref:Uncharacterized protein n=1 Tax=Brassica rapa subsp. trilocularis TaxID=1813537 RepID=A0ABQ7KL23_BRACM|nr:hypothetical protein IGI04_042470 [Brassica rapa subsp. trilocularis]